jgi:hypothetical protein
MILITPVFISILISLTIRQLTIEKMLLSLEKGKLYLNSKGKKNENFILLSYFLKTFFLTRLNHIKYNYYNYHYSNII